jgi:hypothetical protein
MKALAQSGLQPTVEPTGFQPVGGSVDHSAGNYRVLMIMGGELLAYGMAHDVAQLDEKCYLEVYQPRSTRPPIKRKAKV